jgi:hypothetical protein
LRSSTAPLAHDASGEARYTTAAATSSGSATRLKGLCALIRSPAAVASSSTVMSVATYPGATDATVTPCGASATASDWPNACSPALLAPYAGWAGSPRNAPRDPTFTIRPPRPERVMCRTAHQAAFAAPIRLTPSVARHASCHSWYDVAITGCAR